MKAVYIERFQDELNKMLKGIDASNAMLLMKKTGVMQLFLPKLDAIEENELHRMLSAFSLISKDELVLKLSLISYWIYEKENKACIKNKASLQEIEMMLKNLKYPNKTIECTLHLVQHCNFETGMLKTEVDIRKFLKAIGCSYVHDIFTLKKAITLSKLTNEKKSLPLKEVNEEEQKISDLLDDLEKKVQDVVEQCPA